MSTLTGKQLPECVTQNILLSAFAQVEEIFKKEKAIKSFPLEMLLNDINRHLKATNSRRFVIRAPAKPYWCPWNRINAKSRIVSQTIEIYEFVPPCMRINDKKYTTNELLHSFAYKRRIQRYESDFDPKIKAEDPYDSYD